MNYICTYITNNCMGAIESVFIPSLKKNFNGQLVIHAFGVSQNHIDKLNSLGATVLLEKPIPDYTTIGKENWKARKKFLQALQPEDKVLFIDGIDIFFQSDITELFDITKDKIGYTLVDNCELEVIKSWSDKIFSRNLSKEILWSSLKKYQIANVALLVGNRDSLLQYVDLYDWFVNAGGNNCFWGIEVIAFNYLRRLCEDLFFQIDNIWCYDYPKDSVKLENNVFKTLDGRVIKIAHFNLNDTFYMCYFLQGKRD